MPAPRTRKPPDIASAILYEKKNLREFMNEARLSIESEDWPGARLSLGKARMAAAELCKLGEEMQRARPTVEAT